MITTSKKRPLFVPIHETKKKAKKNDTLKSTLDKINEVLNADPTKVLISFKRKLVRDSSDEVSVFYS